MSCLARTLVALPLALATVAAAADLDGFARCLTRTGTTYYTASWCAHCAAQDRLFGPAVRYLRRVDCSNDVGCAQEGIHSYPTWRLANGADLAGFQSLATLGRATGCRLSPEPDRAAGRDADVTVAESLGGVRTRSRRAGGATIIDVEGYSPR